MQENLHIEKERGVFDIITITIDAAIDALSRTGNLARIVMIMRAGDKSRPHLVQVGRWKRSSWSIRKQVDSNN